MTMSHPEALAGQPAGNPGATLRQAREARGWALAEVAAQLNLSAHALGQLEAGQFERLPGHTFARGYVRAYAKLLGLEPSELVGAFDRFTGTDAAAGSAVQSLGRVAEPLRLSRTLLRGVSALLLILLLALAWFWWQERPERLADLGVFGLKHIEVERADGTTLIQPLDEPEDQAVAAALQSPAVEPAGEAVPSAAPDAPAAVAAAAPGEPAVAEAAGVAATPVTPVTPGVASEAASAAPVAAAPATAAAAPAEPAAAVAAAATPSAAAEPVASPAPSVAAGEGLVQVSFTADCWTQVTDGNGRVLVSVVKRAGESLQLAGKAPLELRLGNARGAREVRFNGEPVEHLKNMTASGTVRLNLGQ